MKARDSLRWDTELRLFSRAMMLRWTLAIAVTLLVIALIMAVAIIPGEGVAAFARMLPLFAALAGGLWLLGFVVMAVVFRGRYAVRYTLDDGGILLETRSRAARAANRAAIVAGVLTGRGGVAGAGLIAASQETQEIRWGGPLHAVARDADRTVTIKGPWRTLMVVQCTADNYATVAERIRAGLREGGGPAKAARPRSAKSPLPRYLLRTVLALFACVPMFLVADEYRIDILMPIFVLCFALATVWLLPVLAWAVLGGLAYFTVQIAMAATATHRSFLRPGTTYRAYEVFSGDDYALLGLFATGAAWLAWMGIAALRGRIRSVLAADEEDMRGD